MSATTHLLLLVTLGAPPVGGVAVEPTLRVPAEVRAAPAAITEITAETAGKVVKWVALTPGLSTRPCDGGKTLLVSGPAGRYELLCYTAVDGHPSDPARCVVVIDGAPVPPPADELKKRLAAAVEKDRATKADVLQLAAIYKEAAKVVLDPDVPHTRELLRRLREVSTALLGAETLAATRAAIAEQLVALVGMSSDEPLTEVRRKNKAQFFNRVADALEELSK
jgi:hypothetical protein